MKNAKRTLEELDIIDDYLFNELMNDKDHSEEFIEYFLRTVLGQEVKIKNVIAQSIKTPGNPTKRGIRMDVETEAVFTKPLILLEESQAPEENPAPENKQPEDGLSDNKTSESTAWNSSNTTIDIEMNAGRQETGSGQKYDLRKRSRIYQSLVDVNMLPAGEACGELNNVLIIICIPYDLFGENRLIYTFEYTCLESPSLLLNDGARRIFLNTRGRIGGSKELRDLLKFIEKSTAENANSEELKNLHNIVTAIKSAEERRKWYMWAFEREAMIRDEGREEGRDEGRKEGREEGNEEGRERVNQLNRKLLAASRTEDLIKSTEDPQYQEALFREFGI